MGYDHRNLHSLDRPDYLAGYEGKVRGMNKNNYATLEAAQRLYDAGIVLETDARWRFNNHSFEWILFADDSTSIEIAVCYPAPSMAEVWRGLPEGARIRKIGGDSVTAFPSMVDSHIHTNPTDALIDLYIWTVGQEGGSR